MPGRVQTIPWAKLIDKRHIFSFDSDQKGSVPKGTAFFYHNAIPLDPGILKWISCQEYVKKRFNYITAMG